MIAAARLLFSSSAFALGLTCFGLSGRAGYGFATLLDSLGDFGCLPLGVP